MKKMKRFFALFLAMAMVLGMSMTVFADGDGDTEPTQPVTSTTSTPIANGSITVNHLPKGAKVKYQPILVQSTDNTGYKGWKVAEGITLGNNKTIEDLVLADGVQKDSFADLGQINTNPNVALALQGIDASLPAADADQFIANETGTVTIPNLAAGLYLVKADAEGYSFISMLAYVPGTYNESTGVATGAGSATVWAKGEELQVKKELVTENGIESNQSVTEGDVVPFKITEVYPYYDANTTTKTFTITDTVTGGTIESAPAVGVVLKDTNGNVVDSKKADGTKLKNYGATITPVETNGFKVEFAYEENFAGKTVEITYSVKVGKGSEFKNEVSSITNTGTTNAVVESDKVNATVKKTDDAENNPKPLSGATFELYVVTAKADEATHVLAGTESSPTGISAKGDTVAEGTIYLKSVGTADTGSDGIATFENLDAEKTYFAIETIAPVGYSLNTGVWKLQNGGLNETESKIGVPVGNVLTTKYVFNPFSELTVTDSTLNSLPSTGGIGTTIFTVGGCAIMILAAGMFFVSRRRASR